MKKWVRNYLFLPLLVGTILAVISYFIPNLFSSGKEISYTIEEPIQYLKDPALDNMSIKVNGQDVNSLFANRVKIWNSGDLPLNNITVRLVYEKQDSSNKILSIKHSTTPEFEFGKISELESGNNFKRFEYQLLNPGDSDIITLISKSELPLDVYAKSSGLKLTEQEPKSNGYDKLYIAYIGLIMGALGSLISSILLTQTKKKLSKLKTDLNNVFESAENK